MDNNNVVPGAQPQPIAPQPQPQPITPAQPPVQPQGVFSGPANPAPVAMPESNNKKSKLPIILGCSIFAGAAILGVILFLVLSKSGGITITCTATQSAYGLSLENESNITIKDGAFTDVSSITMVDLKNLSSAYKPYEQLLVDQSVSSLDFVQSSGCTLEKDYVPGDHLKLTVKSNGNLKCLGTDAGDSLNGMGMGTQELADYVQKSIESANSSAVCKQH